MLKHDHNDFPSDLFILLESVDAKVVVRNKSGEVKKSPVEFLGLEMNKSAIVRVEIPAATPQHKFASYKITPR
jgi:xanthine dehydrogenase/oxidase